MANDIKDVDRHSGTETTGHSWDGIKELNTPLPRWWLIVWYITIIWAVIYMIFMPALPALPGLGTNTPGLRGHSDRDLVAEAVADLKSARVEQSALLLEASLEEIETDRELQQFALAMGESLFGDNCALATARGDAAQQAIRSWLTMSGSGTARWTALSILCGTAFVMKTTRIRVSL